MKEDPNNENVWGWLYQVSNTDSEKTQALKKVISINPNNEKAKELLNHLLASQHLQAQPTPAIQAAQNKSEQKMPDPKQQRNILIGIGSIVLVCLICICAFIFSDNTGNATTDHKRMAYIICQLYVEDRLKAPSTADFPSSLSTDIRDLGNNVFEIRSYVDAQNSFGAMIRTNWYCKIQYIGTPEDDETQLRYWNLLQLDISE
jgi:hypothetical protein